MALRKTDSNSQSNIESGPLASLYLSMRLGLGERIYGSYESITRISPKLVLKCGPEIRHSEALTMQYIAAKTTIPVPRVHSVFQNRDGRLRILMDYVAGDELEKVWDQMTPDQQHDVVRQLRGFLAQLRALPPPHPGAVEAVDGTACKDFHIRPNSTGFGPFPSVTEYQEFLGYRSLMTTHRGQFPQHEASLRLCEQRAAAGAYRTVFTHCDLAPRNIIVRGSTIVAVLDWEMAAWMPEYWEYTTAAFTNSSIPTFWDMMKEHGFPEQYPAEFDVECCMSALCTRY
ncbi:Kinase-like protein [Mycena indigotica]|uniref:Kinase-like protein n=1 Tax=Mycena indigotica TaxID=2126181 RepID=A0A8H6SEN8_9AGAR|nr:Kinase-like protein [Mycena indigotica]KAF7296967.1 Kinase-like protein [Mycena indigotica]